MFIRKPRQRSTRTVIRPGDLIGRIGFGVDQVSRTVNGVYVTEEVQRVFRLACGCLVASQSECGDACYYCRLEIEAVLLAALNQGQGALQIPLASAQDAHFASLLCKACTKTCVQPFCSRNVCTRHSFALPGGGVLCLEHYLAFEEAARMQKDGIVKFATKGFIKSLFFGHPDE